MASTAQSTLRVRLAAPVATTAGWTTVAAACVALAVLTAWAVASTDGRWAPTVAVAALAVAYGWLARGAVRLAGWHRSGRLELAAAELRVEHPILSAPLVVPLRLVEAVTIDPRPVAERRVAAIARRNVIAPPTFLDPRIPVVSGSPSAHSRHGAASAPNAAVLLRGPVAVAAPPLAVRLLIRLSTGRNGTYAGPPPRGALQGLRLVVDDVGPLADRLTRLGLVSEPARDRRYLAPIKAADERRARRERMAMVAVVAGVLVVLGIVALAAG